MGVSSSSPRELSLVVGGSSVTAVVRTSRRARRLRMVVRVGRPIEVTVPYRTSRGALLRFLDDNSDWLEAKVAAARAAAARPGVLGLQRPGVAWLAGAPLAILALGGARPVATRKGAALLVSGPPGETAAAIGRWYRREARLRLERAAAREGARLGVRYTRVSVRDQRSRWGSCSSSGTLSFNWRLVLAPPEVLEYVVVHELLHVQEANHSRAFWRLLDEHRPGWKHQASWLREHGHELLAYQIPAAVS